MKDLDLPKLRVLLWLAPRYFEGTQPGTGLPCQIKREFFPIQVVSLGHPKGDPDLPTFPPLCIEDKGLIRRQKVPMSRFRLQPETFKNVSKPAIR